MVGMHSLCEYMVNHSKNTYCIGICTSTESRNFTNLQKFSSLHGMYKDKKIYMKHPKRF
eukprot:UN11329